MKRLELVGRSRLEIIRPPKPPVNRRDTEKASRMIWIETKSDDEAQGELRELYQRAKDPQNGKLDAIMRVHSLHPQGLGAHLDLYQTVMKGTKTLRKADREMIALVVSAQNECHY